MKHAVLMGSIAVGYRDESIFHCGLGLRHNSLLDEQEANARRLVACWNACEGVPTEVLEAYPAPFTELRAQRDELLEAIQAARRTAQLMHTQDGHEVVCIEPHLWAAIIKAKGGAA